jgi:hypothetical protein
MNKPPYTYDHADKDVQTLLNGETAKLSQFPVSLTSLISSCVYDSSKIDRFNKLLGEAIRKYDSCEINNILADALMELSE